MYIDDLETPVVVIDLNILDRNLKRMQQHLTKHGIKCRPHVKSHKIPAIAHMQIAAGAVGITCQKLSEAEVMVNSGLNDILIPYNIVGREKIERLIRLAKRATISVTVDSEETLLGISNAASEGGLLLNTLVECDTGAKRAGVQNPEEVVALARKVRSSKGVKLEGLLTFRGGAPDLEYVKKTSVYFEESLKALSKEGIEIETISAGGTVYAPFAWPGVKPFGVTECRPGVYAYYDRVKVGFGVATLNDCAMKIITTVVSRPNSTRAIIDSGSKTLTQDGFQWAEGFGHIIEYPDAKITNLSEEHGIIDLEGSKQKPSIAERLTIIPNYCNGVTNLHDVVYGFRGSKVEAIWPVAARGMIL